MSSRQLEEEVEVRGPPASKAFDDKGIPTKVFISYWSIFGTVVEFKEKAYESYIYRPLGYVLCLFFYF